MKMFSLILGITVLSASVAHATAVKLTPDSIAGADRGGINVYTVNLDPTGIEGTFDTVELNVAATVGTLSAFAGEMGIQDLDNSSESGFSAFLTAPPSFGGRGLAAFGVMGADGGFSGTHASLGNNSISDEPYVLAQIGTEGGQGTYNYILFDDGQEVGRGEGMYGIPEPGTLVLAGLSLVALAVRRRS